MVADELHVDVKFPAKLRPLFDPYRYKIIHGGRGKGASWGIARALLTQGLDQPLRILCTREVQKSIKDSVHKLLSDQIVALSLQDAYDVLETEIRGKNGCKSEFLFAGLQSHLILNVKSYEGIDRVWAEEAQGISKKSWDVLIPTIRKEGSEIWVSFNAELETDETYMRFVVNPPPNSVVIFMTYEDNPWFPQVLEQERQHCLATMPEEYDNIWLGKCRATVAGAIYAKEIAAMMIEGRYCHAPYDPKLKVHTIWDMGWNDSMAIGLVQRTLFDVRLIDYIEDSHQTLDWYAAQLNAMPFNWGWDWLPHDGFHKDYKTGKDAYAILTGFGRRVKPMVENRPPIPRLDVELGIKACRMLLPKMVVNKMKSGCARFMECMKRYRRNIPKNTNEPAAPVHDQFSHGADVGRHLGLVVEKLTNEEEWQQPPKLHGYRPADVGMGSLG